MASPPHPAAIAAIVSGSARSPSPRSLLPPACPSSRRSKRTPSTRKTPWRSSSSGTCSKSWECTTTRCGRSRRSRCGERGSAAAHHGGSGDAGIPASPARPRVAAFFPAPTSFALAAFPPPPSWRRRWCPTIRACPLRWETFASGWGICNRQCSTTMRPWTSVRPRQTRRGSARRSSASGSAARRTLGRCSDPRRDGERGTRRGERKAVGVHKGGGRRGASADGLRASHSPPLFFLMYSTNSSIRCGQEDVSS